MEVIENKDKIRTYLSTIKANVEMSNFSGYYDIDRELENIIAKLLNLIYGYKLVNANEKKVNFPAVDIVDDGNKLAIQVTADNSYEKINHTFKIYWSSSEKLYEKYEYVKFFMLKGKEDKYQINKIVNPTSTFNINSDIMDYDDLVNELQKLDANKLAEIAEFLENQFISRVLPKLSNVSKISEKEPRLDNYINRFVVNKQDANGSQERLIEVVKEKNRVVLLSDAGKGKTLELKKLINDLNELKENDVEYFPFYHRLNTYVNEEILSFIPNEYKNIYLKNLVFVLDGFDEIEEKNKKTFVRKIEEFCKDNNNVKIIISCRQNFYINKSENFDGTINGFNEFYMSDIKKENIDEFLNKKHISNEVFWNEINSKNLNYIIFNPFYLNEITDIFIQEKELPSREQLMDYIINRSFLFDNNKYRNTIDLEFQKNKLTSLLEKVALTLEYLGRNYLTIDEYNELVKKDENKELLKYSSIWIKNSDGNFSFIHNNFGEYLAAKKINEYSLSTIKKIVAYEKVESKIKPTWINTLTFLVNKYKNNELIEWIISCMPEFICYIENDIVNKDTKKKVLRLLLETYNNQKMWLPYNVRTNNLVSDSKDIEYLLDIMKNNLHYTSVGNALYIIENIKELYELEDEIKAVLLYIAKHKKYTVYNRSMAINILANLKLGNLKELLEIIKINKQEENSTLRKSYFYFCNTLEIVNESIEVFIERWDISKNVFRRTDDNEDIYSWDELQEFYKAFNKISKPKTLDKAIEFINKIDIHDYNEENKLIINICNSIFNTHKNLNEIVKSLLRVYLKVEEEYNYANMKSIIKIIKSHDMLLEFFKEYMKLEHKRAYRVYEIIMDDECMEYYYNGYKDFKYSDDTTNSILRFTNNSIKFYTDLKKLYEERSGEKIKEPIIKDHKKIQEESEKIFINSLFNKTEFINLVMDFLNQYGKDGNIDLETLKDIRRYDKIESNIRYRELLYFLCGHFKEDDKVNIHSFDSWDWDFVILDQIYRRMDDRKEEIELEENQIQIIHNICDRGITKCDFKTALKNNKINLRCLYYWFFRNKFNFEYPENVLLDMLEFEFSTNGKKVGIDYIIQVVNKDKVSKRIIENLNKKQIYYQVFENYVEYCMDNEIGECCESIGKYLLDRKNFEFDRNLAAKYLIKFMQLKDFIDKYFIKLEIKMQRNIINMIIEKDKDILYEWLLNKMNTTPKAANKMFYAQYLISSNKVEGIEYYYTFLKKTKKPYLDKQYYNDINEQLSMISDIKMIDYLIKILELTFDADFKDDSFHGIYNNIRKSIINIGKKDDKVFVEVRNILKNVFNENQSYKHIGEISYMIKDLENEYCINCLNKYTISEIKQILFELDKEKNVIDSYL